MKLFLDTEFTELSQKGRLISLALVSEENHSFYAEFSDYRPDELSDWHRKNVIMNLSYIGKDSFTSIAEEEFRAKGNSTEIRMFLEQFLAQFLTIEVWGDNHAYDWVFFCQLFGGALFIPKNINYLVSDIATLFNVKGFDPDCNRFDFASLDKKNKKHHALYDAISIKKCYEKLI